MKETIKSIMDWHEQTFPEATKQGQYCKLQEEFTEYTGVVDTKDFSKGLEELADIVIVGCGLSRFDIAGALTAFAFADKECRWFAKKEKRPDSEYLFMLETEINKKMETNRQRKWTKGNGEYRHMEE